MSKGDNMVEMLHESINQDIKKLQRSVEKSVSLTPEYYSRPILKLVNREASDRDTLANNLCRQTDPELFF